MRRNQVKISNSFISQSSGSGKPESLRLNRSRALYTEYFLIKSREPAKKHLYDIAPFSFDIPMKNEPTGFAGLPPSGPAIPVIETPSEE